MNTYILVHIPLGGMQRTLHFLDGAASSGGRLSALLYDHIPVQWKNRGMGSRMETISCYICTVKLHAFNCTGNNVTTSYKHLSTDNKFSKLLQTMERMVSCTRQLGLLAFTLLHIVLVGSNLYCLCKDVTMCIILYTSSQLIVSSYRG